MNTRFALRFSIVILLSISLKGWSLPDVNTILKKLDNIMKLNNDLKANVKLTIKKEGQGTKVIESIYYRSDSSDSFLVYMTAPPAERGNGYLRVGEDFWMYRVNTRTFQHINRDESIGGSHVKGGDMEKRKLQELYQPALDVNGNQIISAEKLGKYDVYKLELIAKVKDVTYPKQVYWVRQDNYLPLKVESYSLSGTLMQTALYLNYTAINGKYFAVKMLVIDEFEKGNKTLMEISGIDLKKLDPYIFTQAYLENKSK